MAVILKPEEREFLENEGRIDPFRLLTDVSRIKKGIEPQYLNFDVRRLETGQYNSAYHFHRFAEELFLIISGSAALRTPEGIATLDCGDMVFFERGEAGAHQLYNPMPEPCIYLDIRTFCGYDVCEYPDSDKVYLVPSGEIFRKADQAGYFEGEESVREKWKDAAAEKQRKSRGRARVTAAFRKPSGSLAGR